MRQVLFPKTFIFAGLGLAILALAACESADVEAKYPTSVARKKDGQNIYEKEQSIFGKGGIFDSTRKDDKNSGAALGVNSFLWRASLDTISFMPIASADPFGGTILTDWHTPADKADERFKVNVFIMSRELTADGIRVTVFRQKKTKGAWIDSPTDKATATQLEDSILTRARQLRIAKLGK